MKLQLLEILVCPICKGKLQYHHKEGELVCRYDRLAYPIRKGVPVLLEEKARRLKSL